MCKHTVGECTFFFCYIGGHDYYYFGLRSSRKATPSSPAPFVKIRTGFGMMHVPRENSKFHPQTQAQRFEGKHTCTASIHTTQTGGCVDAALRLNPHDRCVLLTALCTTISVAVTYSGRIRCTGCGMTAAAILIRNHHLLYSCK